LLNFFQEGLAPINLVVDDEFHRAMPGGTGGVKTIANYAPVRSLVGGVQLRRYGCRWLFCRALCAVADR